MKVVPGQFKSFGHDYRGDTAQFVRAAYRFPPVSDAQFAKLDETLKQLELERGERIKRAKEIAAEQAADEPRRARGPKYLRDRGPSDADLPFVESTPGEAPPDVQ